MDKEPSRSSRLLIWSVILGGIATRQFALRALWRLCHTFREHISISDANGVKFDCVAHNRSVLPEIPIPDSQQDTIESTMAWSPKKNAWSMKP